MSRDPIEQMPAAPARAAARSTSTTLGILGAVLGLLGLMVGVAAWFRAAPAHVAAGPVYTEQQVAEAKGAVCDAYAKGMRSIRVVAVRTAEAPADVLPVAVNSRVGEVAVAMYFLNTLEANSAAPAELQQSVRELAQQYQEVALVQLADGAPADWRSNKDIVDELVTAIDRSCQ